MSAGEISVPGEELATWRRDYDRHLYEQIQQHSPDVGMLAGYMLVITDVICDHLPCLNLHPALPDGPIGTWQQVIHELIARRADRSGMVLQRVTTELDRGPTVTWAQYPIRGPEFDPLWNQFGDDPESETLLFHAIRDAGASREPAFILQSLQALATRTLRGINIKRSVDRFRDRIGHHRGSRVGDETNRKLTVALCQMWTV